MPAALLLAAAVAGCAPPAPDGADGPAPGTVSCVYRPDGTPARPADPPPAEVAPGSVRPDWVITTNEGEIPITLDVTGTPCTANSFASLATQGYFDGTTCHRLVDTGIFVLQCGDPTGSGTGGPGYVFDDELTGSEQYPPGTIAMANVGANTNGSQFFLVYADTPLRADYTVFATMDEAGLEVVNRIAAEGQDGSSPSGGGRPNNAAELLTVAPG